MSIHVQTMQFHVSRILCLLWISFIMFVVGKHGRRSRCSRNDSLRSTDCTLLFSLLLRKPRHQLRSGRGGR